MLNVELELRMKSVATFLIFAFLSLSPRAFASYPWKFQEAFEHYRDNVIGADANVRLQLETCDLQLDGRSQNASTTQEIMNSGALFFSLFSSTYWDPGRFDSYLDARRVVSTTRRGWPVPIWRRNTYTTFRQLLIDITVSKRPDPVANFNYSLSDRAVAPLESFSKLLNWEEVNNVKMRVDLARLAAAAYLRSLLQRDNLAKSPNIGSSIVVSMLKSDIAFRDPQIFLEAEATIHRRLGNRAYELRNFFWWLHLDQESFRAAFQNLHGGLHRKDSNARYQLHRLAEALVEYLDSPAAPFGEYPPESVHLDFSIAIGNLLGGFTVTDQGDRKAVESFFKIAALTWDEGRIFSDYLANALVALAKKYPDILNQRSVRESLAKNAELARYFEDRN